jgi:hypothetical protein
VVVGVDRRVMGARAVVERVLYELGGQVLADIGVRTVVPCSSATHRTKRMVRLGFAPMA